MTIKKNLSICLILFLSLIRADLNGQVQLGLYSYSEFFSSPNQSYGELKSVFRSYNKSNFSSRFGISINYKINNKFRISIGGQIVNRDFDCNCVNSILRLSTVYYIGDSICELQLKAKDRILQVPLSIEYSFFSKNKL